VPGTDQELDRLVAVFGVTIQPSDVVLDIGSGVEHFAPALAEQAERVVSVRVSDEGDSLEGIEDESIDVCLSHAVLRQLSDPAVTLRYVEEIGRVLKPKGWALIQVSNDPAAHPRASLKGRLGALVGRSPRGDSGSAVDGGDVRTAAGRAHLDLDRVWGAGTDSCELLLRRPAGA